MSGFTMLWTFLLFLIIFVIIFIVYFLTNYISNNAAYFDEGVKLYLMNLPAGGYLYILKEKKYYFRIDKISKNEYSFKNIDREKTIMNLVFKKITLDELMSYLNKIIESDKSAKYTYFSDYKFKESG